MKKIVIAMLMLLSMNANAKAQWFVAGGMNLGYFKENFQFALLPSVGYEFNDRWAVGMGLGMEIVSSEACGYVEPYGRFNCWNNKKVYIDVKARAELLFQRELGAAQIGFTPSIRYSINDHWQILGDVGLFGVEYLEEWYPVIGVGSIGIGTGVIYKF